MYSTIYNLYSGQKSKVFLILKLWALWEKTGFSMQSIKLACSNYSILKLHCFDFYTFLCIFCAITLPLSWDFVSTIKRTWLITHYIIILYIFTAHFSTLFSADNNKFPIKVSPRSSTIKRNPLDRDPNIIKNMYT